MNPAPPVTRAFTSASTGTRASWSTAPGSITTSLPMTDRPLMRRPVPTTAPRADDRVADRRTLADGGAGQDKACSIAAPASTEVPPPTQERSIVASGATVCRRGDRWLGASGAVEVLEAGLQVGGGRARVDPPTGPFEGEQRAVGDHGGEHLALDRHLAAGLDPVEHRRFEHVGAAVDPVGGRLVPRGFSMNAWTRPSASMGTTP
jgi:hypothetical protein